MDPTHDLEAIKAQVRIANYDVTASAASGAHELDFDAADVRRCVLCTKRSHFYKTMPGEKRPGTMQDVYRTTYLGEEIYLKLQLTTYGKAVVISFKPWT